MMGKVFFEVWNIVYVLIYFIFMISGLCKVLVLNLSFKKNSLLLSARKTRIDFPDKKA
jgi:hypothetical protein